MSARIRFGPSSVSLARKGQPGTGPSGALLDRDLATLYQVDVKVLNQAVKRNLERFPDDFMFQLTLDEAQRSRSQSVTLDVQPPNLAGDLVPRTHPSRRGGNIKYRPYAFTEQGVAPSPNAPM